MKIQVDNVDLFEIADWQRSLLTSQIASSKLSTYIQQQLIWVISQKIDAVYSRFEHDWFEKLRADASVTSIPISRQAFVELVIARSDYKDRKTRDLESQQ